MFANALLAVLVSHSHYYLPPNLSYLLLTSRLRSLIFFFFFFFFFFLNKKCSQLCYLNVILIPVVSVLITFHSYILLFFHDKK